MIRTSLIYQLAEMYLRSEINIWENIQNVAEGRPNSAKYAPPPTRSGSAAAPGRHPEDAPGLVAPAGSGSGATARARLNAESARRSKSCFQMLLSDLENGNIVDDLPLRGGARA